jgi:hypothetical protein
MQVRGLLLQFDLTIIIMLVLSIVCLILIHVSSSVSFEIRKQKPNPLVASALIQTQVSSR